LEVLEDRTLPSSIPLSPTSWTPVGPAPIINLGSESVSGRITGVAADPTNANTVYVASAGGGVWKTTDGGTTWSALTDTQSTLFMGAIAIAPSNSQVIYAGTGEANNSGDSYYGRGILASTDGGATWTLDTAGGQFDRRTIGKIVVDPTTPTTVYAAVSGFGVNGLTGNTGIWKSTDGGANWTNTTAGPIGDTFDPYTDLVINSVSPNILFAAVGNIFGSASNGVYETTNGGTTWTAAGNFPGGAGDGRITLAIAPSLSTTLYAAIQDPTSGATFGSLLEVVSSVNAGLTWTNLGAPTNYMGGQGWYDSTLAVDPSNPNTVYAGGTTNGGAPGIVESINGGVSWTGIFTGTTAISPHSDSHAMTFDANGKLLEGDDGGIFRLDNPTIGSIAWSDLNGNLQITQFTGIALHPTDPNTAYGGSQDNGTEKFAGTLPWSQVAGGDGGFVRIDSSNPQTVYHTFFYEAGQTPSFFERSDDGGATFTPKTSGINTNDPANFYPPYVIDPSNSSRLLLGTDHVYETTNRGELWTAIGTPGVNGFNAADQKVDSIAIAPSAPNTVYVTAGGSIFVTTNDGTTWTPINEPSFTDRFADLVVDPASSTTVYAVRNRFTGGPNGHVFKTTNGGTNWTDISNNLPDTPTNAFALDPQNGALYVGTDIGVYASDDGGTTWSVFQTGLPNVQVVELAENTSESLLAAGTHGRGMFEISTVHFSLSATSTTVNTGAQFSITVTALDPFGHTLTGYRGTVHLSSTDPKAVLPPDFTFTAADNGVHTATGASFETPGAQTITAADTVNSSVTGSLAFTVNVVPTHFLITMIPPSATAGTGFSILVTAVDQFNNVATTYTGTVHLSSSDGQAMLPPDFTFAASDNGAHTVNGIILKTAGVQTLTATDTVNSALTDTVTVNVVAATASHFTLTAPATSMAGMNLSVIVTALDPFDNVATTYTGTVHFSSNDNQASLPADFSFAASDNGVHTVNNVIFRALGSRTLTATDTTNSSITGTTAVTVVAGTATHFSIAPTTNPPITAGVDFGVTITAFDAFGNTATTYTGTVHLSSSDSQAALPADFSFAATDNGVHTVNGVILKTAGTQTLTVTDKTTSSINGTAAVAVVAASASRFLIAPTSNPPFTAGVGFGVTITAQDAFGNTATTYTGTVHLSSSDSQATLPADFSFAASDNGVNTVSGIIFKTAGTQSLTGTDTKSSSMSGIAAVTVVAAAATHLGVAAPLSSTAGGGFNVTVTALDAFGNVATGYTGTVHFASSDPAASLPTDYTFLNADQGRHTFSVTFKTAGLQSLAATDITTSSITSTADILVNAAAVTHFTVNTPSGAQSGTPFSITVTALDAFGNIAIGYTGTVHFRSSDSLATLPTDFTFISADAGVHTFVSGVTLQTGGNQSLTVTDTTNSAVTGSALIAVTGNPFYVVNFPGHGVWRYQDGPGFQQLISVDATQVAVDKTGEVFAVFAGHGVWRFTDATGFVQLLTVDADFITVDGAGKIVAQFNGHGVWMYTDATSWVNLLPADASWLAQNDQGDIAAEFPGHGVWRFEPSTSWVQLLPFDAVQVAIDNSDDVAANFTGNGLWRFTDATSWVQLSPMDASWIGSNATGAIAADLSGHGVWRFEVANGLQQILPIDASQVAIDANSNVIGEFPGNGFWRFTDVTNWVRLSPADASWINVDI
jgi:photosystem II stability/assembly factor-like uncharacterized protein